MYWLLTKHNKDYSRYQGPINEYRSFGKFSKKHEGTKNLYMNINDKVFISGLTQTIIVR